LARYGLLNVNDETYVEPACRHLVPSSDLDPSQAGALTGALTREVSLIQRCVTYSSFKTGCLSAYASPPLIVDKRQRAQFSCREMSFTGKDIRLIRPISVSGLH
jgi:hypothetical protein